MRIDERFIFTNSQGQSVELGWIKSTEYVLQQYEGIGGVPAEVQMQKSPYQDGMTYIDSLLDVRAITIQLMIISKNQTQLYERRSRLVNVFNPKLGPGKLRYEYGSGAREIDATVEQAPVFPPGDRSARRQSVMINLICPDPAWQSPDQAHFTLASFTGGFKLPFSFPISFGSVGQSMEIMNKGDTPSPILAVFKGPLKNPVLENVTTNKRLSVTQTIPAGERIEINTAFGKKSVTRIDAAGNRSNAFHWVSPDSDFWQMEPGENIVSYAATEEVGNASVSLSFYHRYVGV